MFCATTKKLSHHFNNRRTSEPEQTKNSNCDHLWLPIALAVATISLAVGLFWAQTGQSPAPVESRTKTSSIDIHCKASSEDLNACRRAVEDWAAAVGCELRALVRESNHSVVTLSCKDGERKIGIDRSGTVTWFGHD